MTLHVHASNRLEALADALSDVIVAPLASPFAKERILVPSRAMAVWLSAELAKRHGVWANPDFLTPRAWYAEITASEPAPLRWAIAAALPRHLDHPAFAEVRRYLEDDADGTKRIALAARIAELFDRYALHRPDLAEQWIAGSGDHWQARLFRAVVPRLPAVVAAPPPERLVLFHVGVLPPRIQEAVDALAGAAPVHRFELAADGEHPTPSVHACHSAVRECEVLRDRLLDALQATPDLEPRDIRVLCPDLDAYAVAIDAVFGVDPKEPRYVPYRIADRPAGAALPVAEGLFALLDVATSRLTAPAVLDLLYREPIRACFGLSEPAVESLREWIVSSNIRWGADEAHRAEVGQPALRQNTWAFGLERLLLGYAMGAANDGDATFAGVLPADDVDGGAGPALGAFAAFVEELLGLRRTLAGRARADVWRERITQALATFLAASRTTEYQHQLVREALDELVAAVTAAGFTEEVPLAVVRDALAESLQDRGGGFDAGSGAITFARLAPGRATPARVVALLGMNDGVFPRAARPLGFDLMAQDPRPGDPSPRDEDRRVFREALLAARERLIVTFVGRSIKNDAERPPSVVVSELLDAIGTEVVAHPLHAFRPAAERAPAPPFVGAPVPSPSGEEESRPVTVDELCAFFAHPVEAFVKRRVGVFLPRDVAPLEDREPLELTDLQRWAIQSPLVDRARAGEDLARMPAAVAASGVLPLGTAGEVAYASMHPGPAAMGKVVHAMLGPDAPPPFEVDVPLPGEGGGRVVGWLRSVGTERMRAQVLYRYSRARGKHELDAWIRHLAMLAMLPPRTPRETLLVSKEKDGSPLVQRFRKVYEPAAHLAELVALYRLGQRVPLPLFPDPAWTYATQLGEGKPADSALAAARRVYDTGYDGRANDYVAKVYGERDPIEPAFRLFPGGADITPPSFVEIAVRVFKPLLEHREDAPLVRSGS